MNHPAYEPLLQIARDGSYTQEQVASVTRTQITNVTGIDASKFTDAELENVRNSLLGEMKVRDNQLDKDFVLDQLAGKLRVAFKQRFPEAKLDFKRIQQKRAVVIWLDGRPPQPKDE